MKNILQKIVSEYAYKLGKYDIVKFVCMDGDMYVFNYTANFLLGKKTGLPHFVKISEKGDISKVTEYYEILSFMKELNKIEGLT